MATPVTPKILRSKDFKPNTANFFNTFQWIPNSWQPLQN